MKISSLDKFIYFNKRYHLIYLIIIIILVSIGIIISLKIDLENINLLKYILNCLKGE